MNCTMCHAPNPEELGTLGDLTHYRCQACGWVYSDDTQRATLVPPRVTYRADGEPTPVFDNGRCIGWIMPSVHPDVLRATPGIQSWSRP